MSPRSLGSIRSICTAPKSAFVQSAHLITFDAGVWAYRQFTSAHAAELVERDFMTKALHVPGWLDREACPFWPDYYRYDPTLFPNYYVGHPSAAGHAAYTPFHGTGMLQQTTYVVLAGTPQFSHVSANVSYHWGIGQGLLRVVLGADRPAHGQRDVATDEPTPHLAHAHLARVATALRMDRWCRATGCRMWTRNISSRDPSTFEWSANTMRNIATVCGTRREPISRSTRRPRPVHIHDWAGRQRTRSPANSCICLRIIAGARHGVLSRLQ